MKRFIAAAVLVAATAWPALAISPAGARAGPAPAGTPAFLRGPNGRSAPANSGPIPGSYSWPVVGAVIRGFEPPSNPYSAGHRGIDIAAAFGTPIHAPNDGVVSFAGWIGGALYVSIDHADGVRTTYSWLSAVAVHKGQAVARGDVIASTGHGHPEVPTPHLHFGARIGSEYIDPMYLLEGADVADLIRLAPLGGPER